MEGIKWKEKIAEETEEKTHFFPFSSLYVDHNMSLFQQTILNRTSFIL